MNIAAVLVYGVHGKQQGRTLGQWPQESAELLFNLCLEMQRETVKGFVWILASLKDAHCSEPDF